MEKKKQKNKDTVGLFKKPGIFKAFTASQRRLGFRTSIIFLVHSIFRNYITISLFSRRFWISKGQMIGKRFSKKKKKKILYSLPRCTQWKKIL